MKRLGILLFLLGAASPVAAQSVAVRPFFLFSEQRFAASESFDAVFGGSVEPFIGGGAQLALANGLFVDVTISRFKKIGERAFQFDGDTFQLGIPLTATLMPIEVTGGFRFGARKKTSTGRAPRLVPFVGGGIGSYHYQEASDFSVSGDDVDLRSVGFLAVGGAELRVHSWIVVSADVQFTHVGGILGDNGISKDTGEKDLGGIAARFRVIIGR